MTTEDPTRKSEQIPVRNTEASVEHPTLETVEASVEARTSSEVQEALANNENVGVENYADANESDKIAAEQAKNEAAEQITALNAELQQEMNGVTGKTENANEAKEEFPENHIMNSKILDKIAQLEAIDPITGEFNQERYDDYINSESKRGSYSVTANQEKIKEALDMGDSIGDIDTEIIAGVGNVNRYVASAIDGTIALSRGASNTSGSEFYKQKLAQKATELGFKVGQ